MRIVAAISLVALATAAAVAQQANVPAPDPVHEYAQLREDIQILGLINYLGLRPDQMQRIAELLEAHVANHARAASQIIGSLKRVRDAMLRGSLEAEAWPQAGGRDAYGQFLSAVARNTAAVVSRIIALLDDTQKQALATRGTTYERLYNLVVELGSARKLDNEAWAKWLDRALARVRAMARGLSQDKLAQLRQTLQSARGVQDDQWAHFAQNLYAQLCQQLVPQREQQLLSSERGRQRQMHRNLFGMVYDLRRAKRTAELLRECAKARSGQ